MLGLQAIAAIWDGEHDGYENMHRDAELFEQGGGCRVYAWTSPWITIGKFQDPARDLLPNCPVPWVRRPTGGRAVLHGHDVTIGLALSLDSLGLQCRSVRDAYRAAVRPVIEALCACGVPAALGEDTAFRDRTPRSADCFAHVSANDVVDPQTGQKVCGCALRISESAVLLQASIPVQRPAVDPALVFATPAQASWRPVNRDALVTALSAALANP